MSRRERHLELIARLLSGLQDEVASVEEATGDLAVLMLDVPTLRGGIVSVEEARHDIEVLCSGYGAEFAASVMADFDRMRMSPAGTIAVAVEPTGISLYSVTAVPRGAGGRVNPDIETEWLARAISDLRERAAKAAKYAGGGPSGPLGRRYTMSFAASNAHVPAHPERTARRSGRGLNFDVTFNVWPSREAMARAIRKQERRPASSDDWTAVIPLRTGEGY